MEPGQGIRVPPMRVYLDNCCFNRPFDDQAQARIRLETEAKLHIQENIRNGALELVWSYILDSENAANPFEERRVTIAGWKQAAMIDVEESPAILLKASALVDIGLKPKDALHLSCAIVGGCRYFLTTDDDIYRCGKQVGEITVSDPTSFVREIDL